MTAPRTPTRPKRNEARLAVLEEFGFAVANEPAKKIADSLIAERARLDWIQRQLKAGQDLEITREIDDTNELAVMIWLGPREEFREWFAGAVDVRGAIDDARQKENPKRNKR